MILLNLSAAFSTVDHGILLDHFSGLGLRDSFTVVLILSGGIVPEGGLGELLLYPMAVGLRVHFVLLLIDTYMKLLGEVIWGFGLQCHWYANYVPFYLLIPSSDPREAVEILNWCLEVILGWLRVNKAQAKSR